jgi:hypothetical protein
MTNEQPCTELAHAAVRYGATLPVKVICVWLYPSGQLKDDAEGKLRGFEHV